MKRRPNGYVLMFVLLVLLALSLAAGSYFSSMTSQSRLASQSVVAQEIALGRAQFAAEQAILDVRGAVVTLDPNILVARSPPDGVAGCSGDCVVRGPVNNGTDGGLSEGGGLQWEYVIYKNLQLGAPTNRYVVQGTGYYGFSPTSVTFATARVEVELDVGTVRTGLPTDPNGNSGAM